MNYDKMIVTMFGAVLIMVGLGGVPIYVMERDLLRVALFTVCLVCGIVVLGYAAKS